MNPELHTIVCDRLIDEGHGDQSWALLVLAALEGDQALTSFLDGATTVAAPIAAGSGAAETKKPEPPGVYVSSISVSGFRGIGAQARLNLKAGPGLTLVIGRNGSGKSSFAEALECLFTGTSYRWEGRPVQWKAGWKNLHEAGSVALKADVIVEGQGPLTLSRVWQSDALDKAETIVSAKGAKDRSLDSLGWTGKLGAFRPFLSYNELGSLLDEGPSKLYDSLSSVLGLEELTAVQNRLATARKAREQAMDVAKKAAREIAQRMASIESKDDRMSRALLALGAKSWDLDTLQSLVAGGDAGDESAVSQLRRIAGLTAPDPKVVTGMVATLRAAEKAFEKVVKTDAARARQQADLLEAAIEFHDAHSPKNCPVCGATGKLSSSWKAGAKKEMAALRREAEGYDTAAAAREAAIDEAHQLISPVPPLLAQANALGLAALPEVTTQWAAWAAGRSIDSASALADHLEASPQRFARAVKALADEGRDEAQKREDVWRPIASAIAEWLPAARKASRSQAAISDLKEAEKWWKDVSERLRNERFEPIAQRAIETWKLLRLQSNVDLGAIDLEGTGVKRKVALSVTVDGTRAEALGVMSQGELHALALSLFLPRAVLPESPFRFIAIDDPVQSMDPARVDGLARVLGEVAKTRQVIVFTHDDRLPEATRRLGIPATVLSVTRRERSAVEVRAVQDPVLAYLDDARAVAKTQELPADVMARVVPGFCRAAIEAACMDKVRRSRLGKGQLHDQVEELLTANSKTHPLMALALFDDEKQTSEVLPRLNKIGKWAADVFRDCKEGAHEQYAGDLSMLIDDAKRLAVQVRELP